MNTQSIILDTETNILYGLPVQIAYLPCSFEQGGFALEVNSVFDELFSVDQPIGYGAMAVHHIIEADLIGKPSYKTFQMPVDTAYVIAHNVQYDLDVLNIATLMFLNTSQFAPCLLLEWYSLLHQLTPLAL